MSRITYDQEFKKIVIEEALKNGLGYKKIAAKYNIATATARNRITKARNFNNSLLESSFLDNKVKFVDITSEIKQRPVETPIDETHYEIEINGCLLKLNFITLKAVIEVLKNDWFT